MSDGHLKVLMVCLGNICRSPLAHGIFADLSTHKNILVDSAGTAAYHVGNPPDPRSQEVALSHGIDISGQKARQFTAEDFERYDHIYVMDRSNYSNVMRLATQEHHRSKVELLIPNTEVPDPYYGGYNGFEDCYQMILKACQNRINAFP